MAKREISTTLKNLKFMQRAAQREEKTNKEEEVKSNGNLLSPGTGTGTGTVNVSRKCVVIMEGDPHPGTTIGRMSFQSFNPSIDKLNEKAENTRKPETACTSSSCNESGSVSLRANGSLNETGCSNVVKSDGRTNDDLKRKQPDMASEMCLPKKSPKTGDGCGQQHNNKSSAKQPKRDKLDWNVLRPSKNQNRKG